LRDVKTVKLEKLNTPVLKNVSGNPEITDYIRHKWGAAVGRKDRQGMG